MFGFSPRNDVKGERGCSTSTRPYLFCPPSLGEKARFPPQLVSLILKECHIPSDSGETPPHPIHNPTSTSGSRKEQRGFLVAVFLKHFRKATCRRCHLEKDGIPQDFFHGEGERR